jgi:hypothetical protein
LTIQKSELPVIRRAVQQSCQRHLVQHVHDFGEFVELLPAVAAVSRVLAYLSRLGRTESAKRVGTQASRVLASRQVHRHVSSILPNKHALQEAM